MTANVYTIAKHRKDTIVEATGTLEELTMRFNHKLVAGNTYDAQVIVRPKTIVSLVKSLNRAASQLQKGSFDPDFYEVC